jgi:hypothetical protein
MTRRALSWASAVAALVTPETVVLGRGKRFQVASSNQPALSDSGGR